MKVEELIIDGFKSYATRTVISGWDSQFNAITGLNGSGKSNILDAICFVLGISSMSTVRASNLQDLIYKRGQAGVTKASVTIVFTNDDKAKSPIGFENCSKISVTRQIILGGTSKYLINGHKAQQQTVLNLFQSIQLNINNPNFLIMQGRITKVLNMKPSEVLSLIEEAAGTRTFEERKDKAQKTMAKKESKLTEIRSLLQEEIEPKLEKLRTEKRIFLEFQQAQTDLERMTRIKSAHDYVTYSNKYDEYINMLHKRESIIEENSEKLKKLDGEIKSLKEDLEEIKTQKKSELGEYGNISSLEEREAELNNELTRVTTTKDLLMDNRRQEESKTASLKQKIAMLSDTIKSNTESFTRIENDYKFAKNELTHFKSEFNEKEELLASLSTGISAKGNADIGYTSQLKDIKTKINSSNISIEKAKIKIVHLKKELESIEPKMTHATKVNDELLNQIESYELIINQKEEELKNLGADSELAGRLRKHEDENNVKMQNITRKLNILVREIGDLDFSYSLPSSNFDRSKVKGLAAQLFKLDNSNTDKALALQVCAGGRLYNVIVEDAESASLLLEKGKLRKRVTIIPLDKIRPRAVRDETVQAAKRLCPGKVDLALNLIDYDNSLLKAMQYIFGSTFICDDPNTAKEITFNKDVRTRSITLEGDVYDPEGNLSGGSRKSSSSVLLSIQEYNNLSDELSELKVNLGKIEIEKNRLDQIMAKNSHIQNEINLKRHELSLLKRKFESDPSAVLFKQKENNIREIKALEDNINNEEKSILKSTKEMKFVEKEILEFSNDKGGKLKKLEQEVSALKEVLLDKEVTMNELSENYQSAQLDLETKNEELKMTEQTVQQISSAVVRFDQDLKEIEEKEKKLYQKLLEVRTELDDKRNSLLGLDEEFNELSSIIQAKSDLRETIQLELQRLTHDLEKSQAISTSLKVKLDQVIEKNDWVLDTAVLNNILQRYPDINLEEYSEQVVLLEEKLQGMKRKVNTNIMSMIDNVEKKEASLKHMIRTIEKDKSKIENTISKLNGYKRETLDTTYKKVSVDFGNIFEDLLPGSHTKLVPVDENDVTKGLEVKVKLGPVWKESLVELSGGQRSLVALSLIMALLQFKPAPMYILDEVDAALDISHTQNIGHLIKTRFKGSQFIVVSLKEGMFTNANRVFRTRFQDGTSMVSAI